MARRCGNCIYKNVCELYDIVQDPTHAIGCGNFLDVADVVPRSEIEELIMENESLAKTLNEANSLIRKLRNKVEKSRVEVAREIFAEVEKIISRVLCLDINAYSAYEELKKKYTEGEG